MKRFKQLSVFVCFLFLISNALTAEIPEKRIKDVQAKQEVVNQEIKQDEVKPNEEKLEDVKQGDDNQEEIKPETKQDEEKLGDSNQDEVTQEDVNQDEVKEEDANQDEVKQEDANQDEAVTSFKGHSLLEATPMTDDDLEFLRTLDETVPEDVLDFWCQFHQRFMRSFYTHRSQKLKKD